MKRVIVMLLTAVLLLGVCAFPVMADGGCKIVGPETVRASDTITIAFCAGGGATYGSGTVVYDSSQLTLLDYTSMLDGNWSVEFAGNDFSFRQIAQTEPLNDSVPIFYATFCVSSGIVPNATVTASISNVMLNGAFMGDYNWRVQVAEPLSDNANLASLVVSNATISPAFDPNTTEYRASVPFETTNLQVTATAEHAGAKVTVGSTYLTEGVTSGVNVTVTAENGAQKVYRILTWRDNDPNYVPSDVNTMDSLEVDGFLLSPAFDPEKLDYAVYLPYETDHLDITAQVTDTRAELTIPELTNIPVGKTTYEFTVTAENGEIRTYTLTVFRAEEFLGPDAVPEETQPEETAPTTEPTTEPTTGPTAEPTAEPTQSAGDTGFLQSRKTIGLLWILSLVAAFLGGIFAPLLLGWRRYD